MSLCWRRQIFALSRAKSESKSLELSDRKYARCACPETSLLFSFSEAGLFERPVGFEEYLQVLELDPWSLWG